MPVDEGHGLNIPAGRSLANDVARVFRAISGQSARAAEYGREPPSLQIWTERLIEVATPRLTALVADGYSRAEPRGLPGRVRLPVPRIASFEKDVASWDVLNPDVVAVAKRSSVRFAENATTASRRAIRGALADGLSAGESYEQIAKRIRRLPELSQRRARLIASYEASYAMHAGLVLAGRRLGAAGLEWLASSNACPVCLSISGRKNRKRFGEPFYRWPKEGEYQMVYHPPAHANCRCAAKLWFEGQSW